MTAPVEGRWPHSPFAGTEFAFLAPLFPGAGEAAVTWHAELRELSDNALLARLRLLPKDSPERAAVCEVLVERYAHLVRACVRPYRGSPACQRAGGTGTH